MFVHDLVKAIEGVDTQLVGRVSIDTIRQHLSRLTQGQMDSIRERTGPIFHHGHVEAGSMVYVPPGCIVAEATTNGELVHGIRYGLFHCSEVAVRGLTALANASVSTAGTKTAPTARLEKVVAAMRLKLDNLEKAKAKKIQAPPQRAPQQPHGPPPGPPQQDPAALALTAAADSSQVGPGAATLESNPAASTATAAVAAESAPGEADAEAVASSARDSIAGVAKPGAGGQPDEEPSGASGSVAGPPAAPPAATKIVGLAANPKAKGAAAAAKRASAATRRTSGQ